MKGLCLHIFISFLFATNVYSQKLKPVVVKKLEGNIYAKEEYSIIKRGKDKGERHGQYTYSVYRNEIIGTYHFGSKDGEWKYDQRSNQYSEYYTKGHLDSVKGIKDGFELIVRFDEQRDTMYFRQSKVNPIWIAKNHSRQLDTIAFKKNGLASSRSGDTTFYYHSIDYSRVGKVINGKRTGKWRINTSNVKVALDYNDGVSIGTHTSYYPNGQIMAIKSFDSLGQKDGLQFRFYENGDTASIHSFKNGNRHGTEKTYYPNGLIYYEGIYELGRLLEYKEYDSTGVLRKYSNVTDAYGKISRPEYGTFLSTQEVMDGYVSYPELNIDKRVAQLYSFEYNDKWKRSGYFIGGDLQFQNLINTNVKVPKDALDSALEGLINLNFLVNDLGEIENIQVEQEMDARLINEAMRLIQSTSFLWVPSLKDGFPVATSFRTNVYIKLY